VSRRRIELIVVGTSLGGFSALQTLLGAFPARFACPVLVAQHRAAGEELDLDLATQLARTSALPVADASDKATVGPGCVYLAPADYHLIVEQRGQVALSTMEAVHAARPSIDVLFITAADAYGATLAGVVLTGASIDGAAGLARIESAGGLAIVQEPSTADCPIMPRAALAATRGPIVLPLDGIARHLIRLAEGTS
jgi:two-component system, chemotaxis family, protein-glutamate methylesterase/glutaminase